MKTFFLFLFSAISIHAFGQQISYDEWKQAAKNDIRLLPEYGHAVKSEGQLAADQELIEEELKIAGTHRKASDTLISRGFYYLYNRNLKIAMYRFNQAYLLDPKNENVYWGYAVVYFNLGDFDEALRQLEKGLLLNPNSSNILTDKATVYIEYYHKNQDNSYLEKALEIFNQSYIIDPINQNTLYKISMAYYYKKDCANAWKYYHKCMALGGKPISGDYTEALKRQCKL